MTRQPLHDRDLHSHLRHLLMLETEGVDGLIDHFGLSNKGE